MTDREIIIEMLTRNGIEFRVCADGNIEVVHDDLYSDDVVFNFDGDFNLIGV